MYQKFHRQFRSAFVEVLEIRTVLDCAGVVAGDIGVEFEESDLVTRHSDGTLQFASLRVGTALEAQGSGQTIVLDDDELVQVRGNELKVDQVKAYLHGFADSIGTNSFIETNDLRFSPWGSGSGSTTNRFEDFIVEQLESRELCTGLRFSGDVRFELPGEGGELFSGGFLKLHKEGVSSLLRGGDIVEVVESYEIVSDGDRTTLTVNAQFGEMEFVINDDHTLTDKFDRIWLPESEYEIVHPDAIDHIIGDIDGNGTVEFADFLILSVNFGTDAEAGDLNDDGKVDFADFLLLSDNFGETSGTG